MASATDPELWQDNDGQTPPEQWQAVDTDGRWWWTGWDSAPNPITYIGNRPWPAVLEFDWEIETPPDAPARIFFSYYLEGIGSQSVDLGNEVGTGTIQIDTAGAEPGGVFYFRVQSSFTGAYGATVAVLGPHIPAVAPEPQPEIEYGSVINIVEKDVLDSFNGGWTRASPKVPSNNLDYYKSYAMDPNDPLAFWLWPRGYKGADVVVTFAGIPEPVTHAEDVLTLSDMYVPALVDYCVYRTLSKDARAGAKVIAERYRESFLVRLGAGRQILRQIGQNTTRPPDAEA